MAAKSKSLQVIRKHLVHGVRSWAFPRAVASDLSASRNGHTSAYDRNVEEESQASKVPDELIKSDSEKYWSPHPQTGVFGPSSSSTTDTTDENCSTQDDSAMEEKAWFRPTSLEDMDKTQHS
ncbi:Late embryogenesis abundant protein [Hirschfeldia incana]|nr:Late embryogenesis abundant protein [Hirschfeldia incana]